MFKKIVSVGLTSIMCLGLFVGAVPSVKAAGNSYYVSTTGSDSNPGTLSSPFRTIQKASNLVVAGDEVILRGGTYNETITPQTDGTSSNPITYKAYLGETVTISGSDPITGWTLDSGSIYKAPMNWDLGDGNQVFVSGEMMRLAQYPNWTNDSNIFDVGFASMSSGNATSITHSAINKPDNYWVGATVIVKGWWSTQSVKVTSSSGATINFDKLPWSDQYTNPAGGVKYMIAGVKGELDRQREWYYDKNAGMLYLWAPGGVDPNTLNVEAKKRKYAVDLTGHSYIHIEGVNIIGASITTQNASNNIIKGINAQYLSHTIGLQTAYSYDDTGIDLSGSYNTIRDSQIAYSSGNGVVIRGNNNNVINNLIHETDYLGTYNASVSLAGGKQHLVSHNTFYNTGRSIIGGEKFSDSIIEFNDISRTGKLSYDLGGVYFARVDGGNTEIRNNWIHDMDSQSCVGCELGVYIDSNTHNFLIHDNTVWNAATSYYVGGRADNVQIYNNQSKPKIIVNTGDYKYNNEVTNNISEGGVSLQNGASSNSAFIAGNVTTGYNQSAFGTAGHNFTTPPNPIFAHSFPEFSNQSRNYGFEADVEGWTLTGNSDVTYHFAPMLNLGDQFATTRTADGSALFGSGQNGIEQVVTGLQANTLYEFSGWAKVAASEEAWLGVKNYGVADSHTVVTNTSNGWKHVQIRFTTDASHTSATIYMLKNSTGSGAVYGDDIGIRKVRSSELPDPNMIPQSQMTATATSQETVEENNAASNAIDGDTSTIWHTKWDGSDALPQSITLNLGGTYNINKITYLPRPSGTGGIITGYKVYVSTDGTTFTTAASGTWSNDNNQKTLTFPTTSAAYVKLEATASPTKWASAAEINVFKSASQVEVPTAPTGLTATAGDGKVTLSWNGVVGADTYKIYRGTSSGTYDSTEIATVSGATNTSTVTGLTNGTTYYFTVKASNTAGNSSFSTEAIATPKAVIINKVANPGFETGDKTGWTNAGIAWSVVNSEYHSGNYSARVPVNLSVEQSVTGLTPNTKYTLKAWVKVSDAGSPVYLGVKNYGGSETNVKITGTTFQQYSVTFTTGASNTSAYIYLWRNGGTGYAIGDDFEVIGAPAAPTGLTATAEDGKVTLNWSGVAGADNYKVYKGTSSGTYEPTAIATVSGATYNYMVTGLTNATTYYFAVKASNTSGDSSYSMEASAAPKAVSPNVVEITVPASITGVANGTAKTAAALGLPTTVELVTDTAGSLNANVAWDVNASSYDPSSHAGQTFTVNGTVTLPDGVANTNNVALTTSISVTVLPVPVSPQATLTNQGQVIAGNRLDLTMGLRNVTQSEFQLVNAQELTLTYDAANMQLGTVTSLVYGLQVIDQLETVPGHVQIIFASINPDGFVPQGDVLKFRFTAKAVSQSTHTAFSVSSFTIANALGNELQINGASSSTQIIVPEVQVDKTALNALMISAQAKHDAAEEGNKDGLYVTGSKGILQSAIHTASVAANDPNATQVQVNNAKDALTAAVQAFEDSKIIADVNGNGTVSIGDLAIVSTSYGKQSGQIGWNAKADVNKDGKVDVNDLAIVAKAILR